DPTRQREHEDQELRSYVDAVRVGGCDEPFRDEEGGYEPDNVCNQEHSAHQPAATLHDRRAAATVGDFERPPVDGRRHLLVALSALQQCGPLGRIHAGTSRRPKSAPATAFRTDSAVTVSSLRQSPRSRISNRCACRSTCNKGTSWIREYSEIFCASTSLSTTIASGRTEPRSPSTSPMRAGNGRVPTTGSRAETI